MKQRDGLYRVLILLHFFTHFKTNTKSTFWEVVVAQLVERSLLISEVHGLTPVIGKMYIEHFFTINCLKI